MNSVARSRVIVVHLVVNYEVTAFQVAYFRIRFTISLLLRIDVVPLRDLFHVFVIFLRNDAG